MRATVLTDNIDGCGLAGEWGLSIHIEHAGHALLLDTGASPLFRGNAAALGLDLAAVEFGVLSHAHYDHADGMGAFFAANPTAKIFVRAGTRENCFGYHGKKLDYIGIRRGTLRKYADRIAYADGVCELYPGAWLLPHATPDLAAAGKKAGLFVKEGLFRRRADDFAHEQTPVLETESGLVVFSSCSHAGVVNILREVREAFPGKQICALIGGFHLYKTAPEEVRALAVHLRDSGAERIVTGHCTGPEAFEILREELGDGVEQMCVGLVIDIP